MGRELQFQLLGHLGVRRGAEDVEVGSPKQKAVLAVLLLHANEIVSTDRIIDSVWGASAPRTADHSVQIYVSELRKSLSNGASGADLIETRPPGYVINVPPDSVDSLRFERLVREGLAAVRSGNSARGRARLEQAVKAWTGTPLSDFAYDEFAQGYIRSLAELHSDALEALGELELDSQNLDRARDVARRAIEADPLREGPRRVMMLVLHKTGRQAESLRHYAEYQKLLAVELGIEPSEELRQLEEQILLQDPVLDLRPRLQAEGNPYRGLRAFSEDDADVYFGRESLVAEVLGRLEDGPGFVSIVGPSGSGKSSAARAGVTPALRERGDAVIVFQPGGSPLWELAGALDRAGAGSRAALMRRFETDPGALAEVVTRPLVLVVDQFEELFTLAEADMAVRFSELLATGIRDDGTPLRVVATLRADYYDKPLSLPALAGVFSDSVVSVKPMTAQEIERAVVEPAHAVGITVEPALLAQLISDMGDEPGALPLLQFALFELFEKTEDSLTLEHYQRLGGINGALTGGADELLGRLDADGRQLAEQLMMRMIQKGRTLSTARPVTLRDLIDLGVDHVSLQRVLEAFGSRRLITFDRDSSGAAVVEMAHEYLISEWPQMEMWLEDHSRDFDFLFALQAASAEWLAAERSDDYLLRGERLDRYESWRTDTSLMLTRTEREFLDASLDLRAREQAARRDQERKEASLVRRARRRLWAFAIAVAALAAVATLLVVALVPDPPVGMVLWSDTGGVFGELIVSGIDSGGEGHDMTYASYSDNSLAPLADVRSHLEEGSPFFMGSYNIASSDESQSLPVDFPDTDFVWIDCQEDIATDPGDGIRSGDELLPNEACIYSRHIEMGYLGGVAAALQTETRHVGIVIGLDAPFMHPFQVGFEQGVASVDPEIEVSAVYLSWTFDGFASPTLGYLATSALIADGVDVIYGAAGESGSGIFQAIADLSPESDVALWGIGVDVDQHEDFESWK
ncbi:MAG: BTAD domain-containing putative transcriptional regulator, partial [Acidimicrobiia bacterium]